MKLIMKTRDANKNSFENFILSILKSYNKKGFKNKLIKLISNETLN